MTKVEQLYLQLEDYPAVYHEITIKIFEEALEYQNETSNIELKSFLCLLSNIISIFNPFFHYDIDLLSELEKAMRDVLNQNTQLNEKTT